MQIDKNTVIKCNNLDEVKDCLDKLQELGFQTCYRANISELIISKSKTNYYFLNGTFAVFDINNYCVSYKYFIKLYNKQIKEKKTDLIVDKNGKVLKINNWNTSKCLYYYDTVYSKINFTTEVKYLEKRNIERDLGFSDFFISEEACEKAVKRKETENKLKLLAFQLNDNKDISKEEWKNSFIKKCYLYYNHYNNTIRIGDDSVDMNQGTIYCLSTDFKDKAIELIGEEDLKEYLINS